MRLCYDVFVAKSDIPDGLNATSTDTMRARVILKPASKGDTVLGKMEISGITWSKRNEGKSRFTGIKF